MEQMRPSRAPKELRDIILEFSTERKCSRYAITIRWPGGKYTCARCLGRDVWKLKSRDLVECRTCGKQTTITAGTSLHQSHVSLQQWIFSAYLMTHHQALSQADFKRIVGISSDMTLWRMKSIVRTVMAAPNEVVFTARYASREAAFRDVLRKLLSPN